MLFGMADVYGAFLEEIHKLAQLLDRFVIGPFPFFLRRFFGFAEHAGFRITAGPGSECRGTVAEKVHIAEGAVFFVD